MAKIWLFEICLNMLFFVATLQIVESESTYKEKQCTPKLESCSLKVGGKSLSQLCMEGSKGEKGEPGNPGVYGEKGAKGNQGYRGFPGREGDKGDKGEMGSSGPQGPPGVPGIPGSCPCSPAIGAARPSDSKNGKGGSCGRKTEPMSVCKNIKDVKEGVSYTGPGFMSFTCVIERENLIWTCIPPKERKVFESATEETPFWLSSKGLTILDLYNVSYSQIAWIQEQSTSARQKLRYHCKNSAPYDPDNADRSLLMLSWNDITFGPKPSESTPFIYHVHTNECMQPPTGEPRSSDIYITQLNSPHRLPVVDFLVQDLRDNLKDIGVENLELCFN